MPQPADNPKQVPNWDLEQLEIIMDDPGSWQLVVAGPGTGKSDAACQRVAFLADEGITSSRILLLSFTRTAVAELRDRIMSYAFDNERARGVIISTIDSHSWSLRTGFDGVPLPKVFGDGSYELSIERVIELFRLRQADLIDFMGRFEHLIIDEAQDVVGLRADLVLEMLRSLSKTCGLTILADPAQAIYGFTTDDEEEIDRKASLLSLLEAHSPRVLTHRRLENIHRISGTELPTVFKQARHEVEHSKDPNTFVNRVQDVIRNSCGRDFGSTSFSDLPESIRSVTNGTTLVLFRRRADVLFASSFCSEVGIEHRIRMSGTPTVVKPWIGWLFAEVTCSTLSKEDFEQLWDRQATKSSAPFINENQDECWKVLHRLAADTRSGRIDLRHLNQLVARSRPPIELCIPDIGSSGPILGTIHASKGREADSVILVMPPSTEVEQSENPAAQFEEGRVYYVGATRARKMLVVAAKSSARVGYLESRRIFRKVGSRKVQFEVGQDGDVDRIAHLAWTNNLQLQEVLASCAAKTLPLKASARPEFDFAIRLYLTLRDPNGISQVVEIGQMSETFRRELGKIWSDIDPDQKLRPSDTIPHLYLTGITTIGLTEDERMAIGAPYSTSGFALAPVVTGFPTIPFVYRRGGGRA